MVILIKIIYKPNTTNANGTEKLKKSTDQNYFNLKIKPIYPRYLMCIALSCDQYNKNYYYIVFVCFHNLKNVYFNWYRKSLHLDLYFCYCIKNYIYAGNRLNFLFILNLLKALLISINCRFWQHELKYSHKKSFRFISIYIYLIKEVTLKFKAFMTYMHSIRACLFHVFFDDL
ncbi:hypothetical protein H311_00031 [Anncaliia algerae PRA109]|nr:hypothetical protein H311_00031 [Anncaliia algerae PRA109]